LIPVSLIGPTILESIAPKVSKILSFTRSFTTTDPPIIISEKTAYAQMIVMSKSAAISRVTYIHRLVISLQQQNSLDEYPTALTVKGITFNVAIMIMID